MNNKNLNNLTGSNSSGVSSSIGGQPLTATAGYAQSTGSSVVGSWDVEPANRIIFDGQGYALNQTQASEKPSFADEFLKNPPAKNKYESAYKIAVALNKSGHITLNKADEFIDLVEKIMKEL